MVRAAAKNHNAVTIVVNPAIMPVVADWDELQGKIVWAMQLDLI